MKTLYITLFSLLLFACSEKKEESTVVNENNASEIVEFTPEQLKQAELETSPVQKKTIPFKIHVNGTIEVPPQNLVTISFPLGGYLKSTSLLPGMKIKKGEVIAILEHPDFINLQQDYLVSKAKIEMLQKEYDRLKALNATKASSDKALEQAQAELLSEKIKLNSTGEKLQLINVNPQRLNENSISRSVSLVSPINGYVSAVNVNIGKYVNPDDILFELVNPEDLHLSLTVFEKDLKNIQIGQKVKAYINGEENKIYDAEIILIGKKLGASRNVEVHCHFLHDFQDLLPGMFMNGEIEVNTMESYFVPEDAVVLHSGKNYIFEAISTSKFEMIEVETGITHDGITQILSSKKSLEKLNVVQKNAYTVYMKKENKAEEE